VIEVTRLNGAPVVVTADLIEFVEATPDTLISLTTGEKIMVRESVQTVADRVRLYRHSSDSRCEAPVALPGSAEPGDGAA
jgi:flagellar protein FlbD